MHLLNIYGTNCTERFDSENLVKMVGLVSEEVVMSIISEYKCAVTQNNFKMREKTTMFLERTLII